MQLECLRRSSAAALQSKPRIMSLTRHAAAKGSNIGIDVCDQLCKCYKAAQSLHVHCSTQKACWSKAHVSTDTARELDHNADDRVADQQV